MIEFRGGCLPNDPSKPRLRLDSHLALVPPNPAVVDWMSRVTSWPMYGNDLYGCCVWSTIGHQLQALSTYGGGTTLTVTDAAVLKGYADVTGWNPNVPSSDRGTVIQDALNYWRTVGIAGHKILAFAQVDHTNRAAVEAAVNVFGTVHLGLQFPKIAMAEFNAGQPWDSVASDGGIIGGHSVPVGRYNHPGGQYGAVTWARPQPLTEAFWERYVTETWVVITPEWLNTVGQSPQGVDLHGLGEDFAQLTGQANPFPAPTPAPSPTPVPPTPPPTPVPVSAADQTLAAAIPRSWLDHPHLRFRDANTVADALKAWLIATGLM